MLLIFGPSAGEISAVGWSCIIATAVAYVFYFIGLAKAYQGEDLSVAYPIARGIAPMLTVIWGVLFLNEHISFAGLLGILLILAGGFGIHLTSLTKIQSGKLWQAITQPSSLAALISGIATSAYSAIDKIGITHVPPPVYIYLTYTLGTLLLTPYVLSVKTKGEIKNEWRQNRLSILLVALMCMGTYLIVLFAFRIPGSQVSYLVPLRAFSVLFGVIFGVEMLHEGRRWIKMSAAIIMVFGIFLIALLG